MEVYLLDESFNNVALIDRVISLSITKRFFSPGDFTLSFSHAVNIPNSAYYIFDPYSNTCAVIEGISRSAASVTTVIGRTLEALLERRVVYGEGNFTGDVESSVRTAVMRNAVEERNVAGMAMGAVCGMTAEAAISTSWQVLSEWVYDALRPHGASYSVTLNSVTNVPEFKVIQGRDRTRDQSDRSPVVFSEEAGGILNAEYEISTRGYCNVAYTLGADNTCVAVSGDTVSSTERRELFVSAKDIYPEYFASDEAYTDALKQRGAEKLALNAGMAKTRGTIPNGSFTYGIDYSLGDICEVEFSDGRALKARVTSVTYEYEGGEVCIIPAFGDEEMTLRDIIKAESEKFLATM